MLNRVQPQSQSLWEATAGQAGTYPKLAEEVQVSTCIIGGGYTGLSTALHLAEHGVSCAVLESHDIGWGASGRNGGQVIAGLKFDPEELVSIFGNGLGSRVVETVGATADVLFETIARYDIACHAARNGWLQGAHCERALSRQRERARQWRNFGADTRILEASDAASATGSNFYAGAWLDTRGGTIQPLMYARGLAKAASHLGAKIFVGSQVVSLRRIGPSWHVDCGRGSVIADNVVVATNAYTGNITSVLRRTVVPVTSIQIATDPLPADIRETILPGGQALSETRHVLRYSRLDADGRFVIGSQGPTHVDVTLKDATSLIRDAKKLFPQIAAVPFKYVWSGHVAMTADHLPHLHILEPGIYTALGYNGRGVAMATTMGKLLSSLVQGKSAGEIGFPVTSAKPIAFHAFAPLGARLIAQYYDAFDRLQI